MTDIIRHLLYLFIIRKRLIGVMNTPPNWPKNEIRRMVYLAVWVPNGAPVYFFSAMVVFLINQLIKSQIFHFNIFFLCTSAGKRHMATITKKVRLFDGLILQGLKALQGKVNDQKLLNQFNKISVIFI